MNPYQPPSPLGHQPLPEHAESTGLVLSESQRMRLRELLRKAIHPDKVDEFLMGCGALREQLEQAYDDLNLRRSHLLDCYRMKRNVRLVGSVILLVMAVMTFASHGSIPVVISVGLIVYGIALIVTGDLKVGLAPPRVRR